MDNIGFVIYQKGEEPGTLNARWNHSALGNGTGIATDGPVEGFAGKYKICYFNEKGDLMAERQLDIQKFGENYKIKWLKDGVVSAEGLGMLVADGLAAGWRNI